MSLFFLFFLIYPLVPPLPQCGIKTYHENFEREKFSTTWSPIVDEGGELVCCRTIDDKRLLVTHPSLQERIIHVRNDLFRPSAPMITIGFFQNLLVLLLSMQSYRF